MALPTISAHPVNITGPSRHEFKELHFHSLPGSKFQPPAPEEESDVVMQSLRLTSDPRFAAIKHYRDTRADDHHFQRLMNKTQVPSKTDGACAASISFNDIANMECAAAAEKGEKKYYALQERIHWQEAFDKSVSQLLVDFDLTHEPNCRLSHLDRMHGWFLEHGGKQQRKAQKAPGYLTADRTASRMPAGSARDLGGKLSGTSQLLAGSYLMRGKSNARPSAHADGSQTAR